MSQLSMIDLMNEKELREALKQVVEDVERKRREIARLKERLHLQDIEFQNGVLVTNEEYDSMTETIAELVESLEEMIYSNSTKYRDKARALVKKYKKEG